MHRTASLRIGARNLGARIRAVRTLGLLRSRLSVAAVVALCLIPISAIAAYSRMRLNNGIPTDYPLFGSTGAELLRGQWNLVFAQSSNAGGPFELVPYGIAHLLKVNGPIGWTTFYTVTITILVFCVALVATIPIGRTSGRKNFYITLIASAIGIFANYLPTAMFSGHPANVMIPLLWLVGAAMARDRNFVACGITVGLSAGFESWGVLGFVVVFVVAAPRLLPTAIAGVFTILAIYGPFALTGSFHLFGLHWPVFAASIYSVLFPNLHQFSWAFRAFQAVFAILVGLGIAMLSRGSSWSVWLVPLAVLAARLSADPLLLDYYWIAPATLGLSGLAAAAYQRAWIPIAVAGLLVACLWLPRPLPFLEAVGILVVVLACAIAIRVVDRRELRAATPVGGSSA